MSLCPGFLQQLNLGYQVKCLQLWYRPFISLSLSLLIQSLLIFLIIFLQLCQRWRLLSLLLFCCPRMRSNHSCWYLRAWLPTNCWSFTLRFPVIAKEDKAIESCYHVVPEIDDYYDKFFKHRIHRVANLREYFFDCSLILLWFHCAACKIRYLHSVLQQTAWLLLFHTYDRVK